MPTDHPVSVYNICCLDIFICENNIMLMSFDDLSFVLFVLLLLFLIFSYYVTYLSPGSRTIVTTAYITLYTDYLSTNIYLKQSGRYFKIQ